MMAEREDVIRNTTERLGRYLDRKGLEVITEKVKIIRFSKGGGRKKDWRWKGKRR